MNNYFQVIKRDSILSYSILVAVTLSLITFIAYIPALNNGFVNLDDSVYIYPYSTIQLFDLKFFKWCFSIRLDDFWHPLSFITFASDFAIWGLNPTGYHLTSILLHSLNTFLVYILSVRLMLNDNPKFHKKGILAGFVTAFLFGIHPLHVESVAWVAERKDVLCAFFFLLSLLSYLKYLSSKLSRYNYVLCLIFYILALMSKPMAISLPMVFLILDYYPLMRLKMEDNSKKVFIEKIPFFILGALALLAKLWPQFSGTASNVALHPITERMLVFMRGYVFYLQKMLLPTNLAPLYPYPLKVSPLDYEYLGSMVIILLISAVCINSLKQGKLFFCLWLYYIISLIPVVGVIGTGTPHSMADRYTYLPGIAPFMLIGLAIGYLYERYSKRTLVLTTLILLLLSGVLIDMTVKQIRVWHDPMTLWTHEIRVLPDQAAGHGMMGLTYVNSNNYQLALMEINKAIELNKNYVEGYDLRGRVYYWLGNYQRAITDFNKALEIKPGNVSSYTNRGFVYYKMGNYTQSITDLKKAIELDPRHKKAYDNLSMVFSQIGDNRQALIYSQKAADLGF